MRIRSAVCLFSLVVFLGTMANLGWNHIQYDRRIGGYLKRAADANTVELAKTNLGTALKAIREWGPTEGSTNLFYETPDADVGFWYTNLNASFKELEEVDTSSSKLEKSNLLLKLRQTLLDHKESSEVVTTPPGYERFPHNWAFVFWGWLSGICFIAFGLASLFGD